MRKLRILMCCQFPIKEDLGGPKGYVEIAETYRRRGHEVSLVGINHIVGSDAIEYHEDWRLKNFAPYLEAYILKHHQQYDVIEYEAIYLPVDLRGRVSALLVTRSVLLEVHFLKIRLPVLKTFRAFVSHWVKLWSRNRQLHQRIQLSLTAMRFADLVSVSNPDDEAALIEMGIDAKKIIMQPYGISRARFETFQLARREGSDIRIAFVGSFDRRKGAVEFPSIIRDVAARYPNVRFRLLGVLGLFTSANAIRTYVGEDLSKYLEIYERYQPDELPSLLAECQLGIFPSHLESFGFGVLEMMAAGLPVIGYDVPGTSMLLPRELLVPRGDHRAMSRMILQLLTELDERRRLANLCSAQATNFIYETQSSPAIEKYLALAGERRPTR